MKIEEGIKLGFNDVLYRPKISEVPSRSAVNLIRNFKFKYSAITLKCVPILSANMTTVSTFKLGAVLAKNKMLCVLHKFYKLTDFENQKLNSNFVPSVGASDEEFEFIKKLYRIFKFKILCIDVANGYTPILPKCIRAYRNYFKENIVIIAGNVATREMVETLIMAGADVIKVGIGPGSACMTRPVTGVGVPQFSAVIDCADAAHGLSGHIISDGGCTCGGDIAKAFGAGSDFVMLGGMFAGHDECGGETITKYLKKGECDLNGNDIIEQHQFKRFYGMSSGVAQLEHYGEKKDYRASEGRVLLVPYRGCVQQTINEILGGLRSACAYIGARNLKDIPKCATFIRVTEQHNRIYE